MRKLAQEVKMTVSEAAKTAEKTRRKKTEERPAGRRPTANERETAQKVRSSVTQSFGRSRVNVFQSGPLGLVVAGWALHPNQTKLNRPTATIHVQDQLISSYYSI